MKSDGTMEHVQEQRRSIQYMRMSWSLQPSLSHSIGNACHATSVIDQGSWPLLSIEVDKRPDKKFRRVFTGAPAAARGSENKQYFPLTTRLLVPYIEWRKGHVQSLGQRGDIGSLPTSLAVLCAGGMPSTLHLLLALQKQQLVFKSFCIFLFIIFPNCPCM